jgi:16S rRNA (guanine966-N2)-methyltransferase
MLPDKGVRDLRGTALRIIGGSMRGRKIAYTGDPRTRPMKDRVREAVFNLLGTDPKEKLVLDLFAGTGALGLEAISRGAVRGMFFERHFGTAAQIRENISALGLEAIGEVVAANTFLQFRGDVAESKIARNLPWLVFCSPPYAFYHERRDEMLALLTTIDAWSPEGSVLVVEADEQFDFGRLPHPESWDIREYPPAVIGIHRQKP